MTSLAAFMRSPRTKKEHAGRLLLVAAIALDVAVNAGAELPAWAWCLIAVVAVAAVCLRGPSHPHRCRRADQTQARPPR